jgi:hypothetical protein
MNALIGGRSYCSLMSKAIEPVESCNGRCLLYGMAREHDYFLYLTFKYHSAR